MVMFGELHIEMAAWKTLGVWLEGSGWTDGLTLSDVASSGKADSYINASYLTRTRYAHQITTAALYSTYKEHMGNTQNIRTQNVKVQSLLKSSVDMRKNVIHSSNTGL